MEPTSSNSAISNRESIVCAGYLPEWRYFLTIEKELIDSFDCVEPCEDNLGTFSTRYAKILLAASSAVDTVFKALCAEAGCKKACKIDQYKEVTIACIPDLVNRRVVCISNELASMPWAEWREDGKNSPSWWRAYNGVKHEYAVNFNQATLGNAFDSLAGLLSVLVELYTVRGYRFVDPAPCLLDIEGESRFRRDILVSTSSIVLSLAAASVGCAEKSFE